MKVTNPPAPVSKEKKRDLHMFKGNERILVVDDEPFLVRAHKMQLTRLELSQTNIKAGWHVKVKKMLAQLLLSDYHEKPR